MTEVWRDHVYPLAQQMKMKLLMPPIQTRTRLAHIAAKWASDQDRFAEYNTALFKNFFQNGTDIGNPEILYRIAAELAMDPEDLQRALESERYVKRVRDDRDIAQEIGVRAVPAFAAGGHILAAGVQTARRLQELWGRGITE